MIAVKACGVNYPDLLIIEDRYQYKPARPFSPGGEVAGIVEAVGSGVTSLKVGDRVIGSSHLGRHGREAGAQGRPLHSPFPASMPMDEAAALILTYGTSIYALKDRAKLAKGETLLVLGAAGGVGLSAVELGKAMGARVIAAASTEEKLALAKKHGADDGVVYPAGPFDKAGSKALADLFKKACGETGANVIYDPVGGDYSEAALRAIALGGPLPGGRLPGRHRQAAAQSDAAQVVPGGRRVLGRVHAPRSRRQRRQHPRADAVLCRRRDPAAGVGALSAGAGGRGHRQARRRGRRWARSS